MTYEVAINMHIGDDGDIKMLIKRFHYHSKKKHVIYIRHILALLLLERIMHNLMKAIDESYAYITFFGRFIASFLPDHKLIYREN